jgi:hypothetical protein
LVLGRSLVSGRCWSLHGLRPASRRRCRPNRAADAKFAMQAESEEMSSSGDSNEGLRQNLESAEARAAQSQEQVQALADLAHPWLCCVIAPQYICIQISCFPDILDRVWCDTKCDENLRPEIRDQRPKINCQRPRRDENHLLK